jgi:iron complex outermembrane receptor protein
MTARHWALGGLAIAAGLPAPAQEAAVRGEKIEVTGSHIRRIEAETALPVSVITREEIRRSGVTSVEELMEKVTANVGGYNTARGLGDGTSPGLAAASLRGLGPNSTLVLLNGRRLANFAFNGLARSTANLNQIPLAAVERVEVLKDGASAIYGTDAIAGVVNFILRKDYAGAEATAYGSSTHEGGGQSQRYTGTIGFGDVGKDRFNVMAALDYRNDAALKASQRPSFAATGIRPDLGLANTSQSTFPANFDFAGRRFNLLASQGCAPEQGSYRVTVSGQPAPFSTLCRYDFTSVLDLLPPSERRGLFARGVWAFSPDHQAFVEYHLSRNEIVFAASEVPVAGFTFAGPFLYPAGGPFYPASFRTPAGETITPTGNLVISWRAKPAGLRTNRAETEEDRLVAGMQGALAGWDYNGAFTRSTSNAKDIFLDGHLRTSLLQPLVASGRLDVFSGAPLSAEAQALLDATKILGKVRDSDSSVTSYDVRASRELLEMKHGVMSIALGLERREEDLEERPEEVLFSGDIQGGGGALPPTTRADRTLNSAFAELVVPFGAGLEAQLALRHDRFSDFGSTTNPKVALRWTPHRQWLARASFGTGFRAPTLTDLFLPRVLGLGFGFPDPARCPGGAPLGDFVDPLECEEFALQGGGNTLAQPEKSRQWTLGFVFEPSAGTSIGVDYWSIHRRSSLEIMPVEVIYGTFAVADPVTAGGRFFRKPRGPGGGCAGDGAVPTPAGVPCPLDYVVSVIENVGNHNVSGVDLSFNTRLGVAAGGNVSLRAEGTYYLAYRYQDEPAGPYLDAVGVAGPIGAMPRWRHYIQATWQRDRWEATLAHNFLHGYNDERSPARRVASAETWDLQATWRAAPGLDLTGGVRNLFDRDPPASRQANTFQVGYDARYLDPRGRTYYLSARYAFR